MFTCDRCGKYCGRGLKGYEYSLPWELTALNEPYQTLTVKKLCESCGKKANSFVHYHGTKKQSDKDKVRKYLDSGSKSKQSNLTLYSALQNAGYY